jgi:PAS domain-containing protein
VLDTLGNMFGKRASDLSNRSYILSAYLFVADSDLSAENQRRFVTFTFLLLKRLQEEARKGMDRKNRELYTFQTFLSSAPGEKYQIDRRHQKLAELFKHFQSTGKIKGD